MELYNRSLLKDLRHSSTFSDFSSASLNQDRFIEINTDIIHVLSKLNKFIVPGISDSEIDLFIRSELDMENIPDCYLPGPGKGIHISLNNEKCHGTVEGRIIKSDDLVTVDISIPRNNIYGDAAWSYLPSSQNITRNQFIKEAAIFFMSAMTLVAGKENLSSLACPEILSPPSSLVLLKESSGHGIGRYLHMPPYISWTESSFLNTKIPDNSFFTLELILGNHGSSDNVHFEMPFYKSEGIIRGFDWGKLIHLTL